MKSFNMLIRLKKEEINNKRQILNDFVKTQDQLDVNLEILRQELIEQQQSVTKNPELFYNYGNYINANKSSRELILNQKNKISQEVDRISQEIFILFCDLKKFEIILENKKKQKIQEENREESIALEQIIINQFLKNK